MSQLEKAIQMAQSGNFAEARTLATQLFEADRSSAASLRVVGFCDFYLDNLQGFFDKYIAILRQAPNAPALQEFLQLLGRGLGSYKIVLEAATLQSTLELIADTLRKPIFDGEDAKFITGLAPILGYIAYQTDELTSVSIEPFAKVANETVVKHVTADEVLARTNPSVTRFTAYLLGIVGEYDKAMEMISVSTFPITIEEAIPSVAADQREEGTAGSDTPERYELSPAVRRGGRRAIVRTVPDGALGRVLDLGCGTGAAGRVVHERAQHITGVDLDAARLEYTKKAGHYADLVKNDAISYLESGDERFDTIMFAMATPMIPDLRRLIRGTAARVKPGGSVCFDVLLCGPGAPLRGSSWSQFVRPPEEVRAAAAEAGLAIEQEQFGQQEWGIGGFYRLRSANG